MKIEYIKDVNIKGLRLPKIIINYNDKNYILGSYIYNNVENKIKYLINYAEIDNNFNFLTKLYKLNLTFLEINYFKDINISSWLRDTGIQNDKIYLLIEIKYNKNEKLYSKFYKLYTKDFINFEINTIYNINDTDLLWLDYKGNIFKSNVTNTDIFKWGQYTFNFIINNQEIAPKFDKYVLNNNYQGQVLHNMYSYDDDIYDNIIFSIRHKTDDYFEYELYTAKTTDYINFFETEKISISNKQDDIKWLCYPYRFKFNNEYYLITNKNDFGKKTNVVLFKIVEDY